MAERVELFEVTTPAATADTAPISTALTMDMGVTRKVEIIIPPGPSGFLGFRIVHSGQTVIPYSGSSWIIGDGEKLEWALDGYPVGAMWSISSYNTDIYEHTIYLRWFMDEIPDAPRPSLALLAIE